MRHGGWLANPTFGSAFGPLTQRFFPSRSRHTAQTLVDLVKSRSYYLASTYLTSTWQRRAELESQVRELVTHHPDLVGRDEFDLHYVDLHYVDLHYVAVVFRAERL